MKTSGSGIQRALLRGRGLGVGGGELLFGTAAGGSCLETLKHWPPNRHHKTLRAVRWPISTTRSDSGFMLPSAKSGISPVLCGGCGVAQGHVCKEMGVLKVYCSLDSAVSRSS